jgi:hypothetical protein
MATAAAVLIGVFWGVPAAARHVAFQLPPSVGQEAERVAFELLDRSAFEANRLDRTGQERLQTLLAPLIERDAAGSGIHVHFRDAGKRFGANALAGLAGRLRDDDRPAR